MRKVNRIPALVAVCWGVVLLLMMPASTQLIKPGGVAATWSALMCAEALLLILCAWAQLSGSSDTWTRVCVIAASLVAIYVGVDLNEARDAQHAFDAAQRYNISVVSNNSDATAGARPRTHHKHAKNSP